MLEVVVGGAITGIGTFIFGYLVLVIFRWISPDGFMTKLLEDELKTEVWEKPTAPDGSREAGAVSADLLRDGDLSSGRGAQSGREASSATPFETDGRDAQDARRADPGSLPSSVLAKAATSGVAMSNNGSGLVYIIAFLSVIAVVVGVSVIQSRDQTITTELVSTQTASNSVRSEPPTSAIVSGNAEEQVNQGLAYYHGQGVVQNNSEAARLFRLAANQGNSDGQNNLGVMYEFGLGVPQDNAEAVRLYRLAAAQGNANARTNLNRFEPMPASAVSDAQQQSGLSEADCIDISLTQGMGAGERCWAQVAGRPQAGLNEGDCIDISLREGMGAGERCRAQVRAAAARH